MRKSLPARCRGTLPSQVTEKARDSDNYANWETRQQVLDAIPQAGRIVSAAVVERWCRQGILPHGTQAWRAGHPGSVTLFPPGTSRAAFAAANIYQLTRNPEIIAWRLWRHGFPVEEAMWRSMLENNARRFDRLIVSFLRHVSDPDGTAMSLRGKRELDRLRVDRTESVFFRRLRKRLGQDFSLFVDGLVGVTRGEFQGWSSAGGPLPEDLKDSKRKRTEGERERIAMAKALTIPHKTRAFDASYSQKDAIATALEIVSRRVGGASLSEFVTRTSADELLQVRNEWRALVLAVLAVTSSSHGSGQVAFTGTSYSSRLAEPGLPAEEAPFLLALLVLRAEPGFRDGVSAIIAGLRGLASSEAASEHLSNWDPALYSILLEKID